MIAAPPVAAILTEVANQNKDIMTLVQEAMKRAQASSIPEFLSQIQPCKEGGFEAGRVSETSQRLFFLLSRDVEEPETPTETSLRQHYSESMHQIVPKEILFEKVSWKIEPDFIVGRYVQKNRQICLQSSLSAENSVETLVHELVHYTRPDELTALDLTREPDALAYALRAVSEKGDEVDAYLTQYSLHIRRQGKNSLPHLSQLSSYFNDQGEFTSDRARMARFVVEDLGYFRQRFTSEYKVLLEGLKSENQQRQQGLEETLASRQNYILGAENFLQTRWKILNRFWPKYRQETARVQKFLTFAVESRDRLSREKSLLSEQSRLLQEKLQGLSAR